LGVRGALGRSDERGEENGACEKRGAETSRGGHTILCRDRGRDSRYRGDTGDHKRVAIVAEYLIEMLDVLTRCAGAPEPVMPI
jgi:hypothetical protein